MADPESPFYIRPRLSMDLFSWLWKFQRACTRSHVRAAGPLLRDLHLASRAGYERLRGELGDEFGWSPGGLLMLCKTESSLHEETETAGLASELGVPAEVLSADDAGRLDPGITMDVRGAVYYPKDCHLSPNRLMAAMEKSLADNGVDFLWNCEWSDFITTGNQIQRVVTSQGEIAADEVIVCGGVWSPTISQRLNVKLPIQAGKGYSVTLSDPREQPKICSILTEARVAVTPIGNSLRFGGTMEIAGLDETISAPRVRGILRSIEKYFPKFNEQDFDHCKPWVGLRPCSPDGLPYIGRTDRWKNVIINTGHAMMGISLAMVSGQLVAEIVDGRPASIAGTELLSPNRYR